MWLEDIASREKCLLMSCSTLSEVKALSVNLFQHSLILFVDIEDLATIRILVVVVPYNVSAMFGCWRKFCPTMFHVYKTTLFMIPLSLCRNVCQKEFPQSLPKLLQSVNWNNRTEVAQVTRLYTTLL